MNTMIKNNRSRSALIISMLFIFAIAIGSCSKQEPVDKPNQNQKVLNTLKVGDSYRGGILAYIFVSGDPGYDANVQHGLIAATVDQSRDILWDNGIHTTTGATGTAIGTGLANTNTLIFNQSGTPISYAAGIARAYTGGGFNDWFLPSKDELNKLFLKRVTIGGFSHYFYWSSSEYDDYNAWSQNFYAGDQYYDGKNYSYYVRAVRAF
jgi:hypothetical protein